MKEIKKERFNSNNAWGFGGASGTITEYDNGIIVQVARNQHRHTDTSSANRISVRVDEDFSVPLRANVKSYKDIAKLGNIKVISLLKHDDNYKALVGNIEECIVYDNIYKRIKKIEL